MSFEHTLAHYNAFMQRMSWYKHAGEYSASELSYLFHGLAGEAGEASDVFKKVIRVSGHFDDESFRKELQRRKMDMTKELGDITWYFQRILDFLHLTYEDIILLNTLKLFDRLMEREEHGIDKDLIHWPFHAPHMSYAKAQELHERLTIGGNP